MRRIHSTYLGRTTIPRDLTDFEMREFFTLSAADRRAIRGAIRSRLRLPVALQVGFLRMTGTTLDAFDYVPRELLEFLGQQLQRSAPMLTTLRGLYRRRKPAHLKAIIEPRRTLEVCGFLHSALPAVTAWDAGTPAARSIG